MGSINTNETLMNVSSELKTHSDPDFHAQWKLVYWWNCLYLMARLSFS